MLQNFNKELHAVHKDKLKESFRSEIRTPMDQITGEKDVFNINTGYLLSILRLIDEYTILKVNGIQGQKNNIDYYMQMWEILEMILDLVSPKMDEKQIKLIDDELTECRKNIAEVFQGTQKGIWMDPMKALELRGRFGKMFRNMLVIMERRGMLTYIKDNPLDAMSNFSD